MIEGVTSGAALSVLIGSFAELAGLPPVDPENAEGLEIQAGPYVARVLPDPADDNLFLLEVDVCPRGEAGARGLEVMHRLNYAARLDHGWTAGIDGEDTVVIYTRRAVRDTDAGALERLISDGIDRAAALRRVWTSANTDAAAADAAPLAFGAIRG